MGQSTGKDAMETFRNEFSNN